MKTILIDWSAIQNREEFYASVLPQTESPSWHGHNLDAMNDSWITESICPSGPPFKFIFRRSRDIPADLKDFADAICQIASNSVKENGGEVNHEA